MTTYNTGNSLGSSDPRDLYDNAENLDNFVNGDQAAYNDRLGKSRRSWQSVEDQVNQQEVEFNSDQSRRENEFQVAQEDREGVFNAYLVSAGYQFAGDYAAGIEITQYNQVVRDTSGEFWRLTGSTNLPYTTTGAGLPEGGAFVAVGDGVLRQELADNAVGSGSDKIAHTGTDDTVTQALNRRTIYVGSLAALPDPALEDQVAIVSGSGAADGNYKFQSGSWTRTTGNAINKDYGTGAENLLRGIDFENRYKSLTLAGSVDYGEITLPGDFQNNIDFNLWRGADGRIHHDFDVSLKTSGYKEYYISQFGNNSADGLTPDTARRNLRLLMEDIEADGAVDSAKIHVISDYMTRDYNYISIGSSYSKNYHFVAGNESGRVYFGSIERGLSWTLESAGVYRTTKTQTVNVFDSRYPSFHGLPFELTEVDTLSECQASKGTWYTDGSLVYVHLLDDSEPDNDEVYVCVRSTVMQYRFAADSLVVFTGFDYLCGGPSQPFFFDGGGAVTQGNVILEGVRTVGSDGPANGISTSAIKSIWSFDCVARDHGADGFNYHSDIDGDTFAFEFNCIAEKCGETGEGSENATTAHDGMRVLRIGSKGGNSFGPVLADVNGCYSVCYDCEMGESLHPIDGHVQRAAYRFSDSPSSWDPAPDGKAVLINCSGGSAETFGISCDDSFKSQGKITVKNFRGVNVPSDILFDIM